MTIYSKKSATLKGYPNPKLNQPKPTFLKEHSKDIKSALKVKIK